MPANRFQFLYGGLSEDAAKTASAAASVAALEAEFGGGIWDPEKNAVLHANDIVVFPSKDDIITGASGKWVDYPSLGTGVRGYKDLLAVNGTLKLVSHKSLNKSYRLKSDPKKWLITAEDTLRRVLAVAGTTIGQQLRCLAWLQENGFLMGWKLKSTDARKVLKFKSDTDEESQRDYIFVPVNAAKEEISLPATWVAQWESVKDTYGINDANGTPTTDNAPF